MTYRLKDGRVSTYYGDTDVVLQVFDDEAKEVQFRKDDSETWNVELVNNEAQVPNDYFNGTYQKIIFYISDGVNTLGRGSIDIIPRVFPSDYSYEPTRVQTYESILAQMKGYDDSAKATLAEVQKIEDKVDDVALDMERAEVAANKAEAQASIATEKALDASASEANVSEMKDYVSTAQGAIETTISSAYIEIRDRKNASVQAVKTQEEESVLVVKAYDDSAKESADKAAADKDSVSTMKTEIEAMKASVEQSKNSVDTSKADVTTMESAVSTMKADIETTTATAKSYMDNAQTTAKSYMDDAQAYAEQAKASASNASDSESDVTAMKSSIETSESNVSTLVEKVSADTAEVSSMKSSVEQTKADVSVLADDIVATKESALSDIETKKTNIVTLMDEKLEQASASATSASNSASSASTTRENMNSEMSATKTEIEKMKTSVKTSETNVTTIEANVSSIKDDITTSEANIASMKTSIEQSKSDVSTMKTDVSTMKTEVSDMLDGMKTQVAFSVDSSNSRLYHLSLWGENVASFEVPPDKFLKSVTYNEKTQNLIFTFMLSGTEESTVPVDISSLVDTYTAGDGLQLGSSEFSLKIKNGETHLKVDTSGVYVDLSDIMTALSGKSDTGHTHTKTDITDFPSVYTQTQVTNLLAGKANTSHEHTTEDITDFPSVYTQTEINNKLAGKSDTSHTHAYSAITDKPTLATVATSGSYSDLSNKPSIPTVDSALSSTSANAIQNKAVNTALSGKANKATTLSGYGITDAKIANGTITLGSNSITPLTSHQSISGKENTSNKVTSWSSTTTDTNYPSEKLVKTSLDGKSDTGHTHDGRYYTESEIDSKLSGYSPKAGSSSITTIGTLTSGTVPVARISGLSSLATKAIGTSTTTYLRNDGAWATPPNTTYSSATTSVAGLVKIGNNITVSSGTISLTKDNVTKALGYTPPSSDTNTVTAIASTTGSGNAVTAITASGGQLTVTKGTTFSTSGHNHNDLYYTESEVDTKLSEKASSSHTHTTIGDGSMKIYGENSDEVNFGGTGTSTTVYFGYRAKDSKAIPTKFVFGGSSGSATIMATTVYGAVFN